MNKDSVEQQAIVKAVIWGDAENLAGMMSRGCSVRFRSRDWGKTPWMLAIERALRKPEEYGPIVELLAAHSDPLMRDNQGYTALQEALRLSGSGLSPALVKTVLDQGGLDVVSPGRAGVLSIACEAGNIECCQMVWDAVKKSCSSSELIMACAVSAGHDQLDLFELALGWGRSVAWHGAGIESVMWSLGKNAVKHACVEILHALDRAGMDWSMQEDGQTLLMVAAEADGSKDMALKIEFLSSRISPREVNRDGWTPLHMAARSSHAEAVEALIPLSAPGAVDRVGRTALHLASEVAWAGSDQWRRSFKMLSLFCDPQASDEMGNDALMLAVKASNPYSVEVLLPVSDLRRTNRRGRTAKDYALEFSTGPGDEVLAKFVAHEFRKNEQDEVASASSAPGLKSSARGPRV